MEHNQGQAVSVGMLPAFFVVLPSKGGFLLFPVFFFGFLLFSAGFRPI